MLVTTHPLADGRYTGYLVALRHAECMYHWHSEWHSYLTYQRGQQSIPLMLGLRNIPPQNRTLRLKHGDRAAWGKHLSQPARLHETCHHHQPIAIRRTHQNTRALPCTGKILMPRPPCPTVTLGGSTWASVAGQLPKPCCAREKLRQTNVCRAQ